MGLNLQCTRSTYLPTECRLHKAFTNNLNFRVQQKTSFYIHVQHTATVEIDHKLTNTAYLTGKRGNDALAIRAVNTMLVA